MSEEEIKALLIIWETFNNGVVKVNQKQKR